MNASPDLNKTRRPVLAGLWLMMAIPFGLVSGWLLGQVVNMGTDFEEPVIFTFFFLVHLGAGYLWARSLCRRSRFPGTNLAYLVAGIGFGLFVIGGRQSFFPLFESLFDLLRVGGKEHLEFQVVFVTWTGLVTGGTGLFLGLGLRKWKLAIKFLGLGFLGGAAVFFVVAFLMDSIGFRVGTPRPDGLPSMVITTFLGIWGAALVGSAIFGRVLAGLSDRYDTSHKINSVEIDFAPKDKMI